MIMWKTGAGWRAFTLIAMKHFTVRVSHASRMASRHTIGISEFSNARRVSRPYNNPK